jgi:hypothetical protein
MFRTYRTLWSAGSMAVGFIEQFSLRLRKRAYDNRVIYILLYSQLNPFRPAFDQFYNGYVSQVPLLTFCFVGTCILVDRFRNMFLPPSAGCVTRLYGGTLWNTPITVLLSFDLECVFRLVLPH